jgi:3-carboxy-cis,cis-muconate cycloisomerase
VADPSVGGLFSGVYASARALEQTTDAAWLAAMLDVEAALATAGARVGLVPAEAAESIVAACVPENFDVAELGRGAAAEATPVIALVARLRSLVPSSAAGCVHLAATSQDVMDTAAMLVARRALAPTLAEAAEVAGLLAGLARQHRDAPQAGRTLLQHAVPTTYGAACAARLVALDEARSGLARVCRDRLAVQLGGAAGTLAPAGEQGIRLVAEAAAELGLAEPVTPWHTSRGRVAELAGGIGVLVGELAAAASDVVLLSAGDIGELTVASPGGSSAMPHKRNPSSAVLALACAHRVPGLVATVLAGMPQELQRAAGRWQAEWGTLTDLLRLIGGTAHHTCACYRGLRVDTDAMRANLRALLGPDGEPDLGSAAAFVDRALAAHAACTDVPLNPSREPAG